MPAKIEPNSKRHLAESARQYKVWPRRGDLFGVVLDTDEFRAGITTDPYEEYFQRSDLTGQFVAIQITSNGCVECCKCQPVTKWLHVVLLERQELASWPSTVGE